ncbi:MAG TPA: hypothetical protein VNO20_02470 [Solirubrobacterales bacterium]|nr:hypothetical protein [Solirubrobacterales bacterium]
MTGTAADTAAATAVCPAGEVAIGGGGNTTETQENDDDLTLSAPVSGTGAASGRPLAANGTTPTGWRVQYPDSGSGETVTAYVICAPTA